MLLILWVLWECQRCEFHVSVLKVHFVNLLVKALGFPAGCQGLSFAPDLWPSPTSQVGNPHPQIRGSTNLQKEKKIQ